MQVLEGMGLCHDNCYHRFGLLPKPVVWADMLSIGKVGFSATPGSKTPEGITTKLGVHNYIVDPTLTSKYGSDGRWGCVGGLGACMKYHCLSLSFFPFFCFFTSPTGWHHWPIFMICISSDAFSLTSFGGLGDEFSTFLLQNLKIALRPMATLIGNSSGIFKDRSKMFVPKVGFLG